MRRFVSFACSLAVVGCAVVASAQEQKAPVQAPVQKDAAPVQAPVQKDAVQAPVQKAVQAPVQKDVAPVQAPVQKAVQAPVQAPVQKVSPVQKPVQAPTQKHVQADCCQSPVQKGEEPVKSARGGLFSRVR